MSVLQNNNLTSIHRNHQTLRQMLDAGISDMESGRELPLEEAFKKITELRNSLRNAKLQNQTYMGSSV